MNQDIYTEPELIDTNTLNNLGPLTRMAGIWRGERGSDIKPKADGAREQAYVEHYELQPIDPQTNGPQLLYGLRYVIHITKPGQIKTYHEQVGYWLWEPLTQTAIHTLTIPRGMALLASAHVAPGTNKFTLQAILGGDDNGIVSNAFLNQAFRTTHFMIEVSYHQDGSWSYAQDTVLQIQGQATPFHHKDTNVLYKVAEPSPNPLARML